MALSDFADEIKTNMETVMSNAQAADVFNSAGNVYNYNEWPGSLVGLSALIGIRGVDADYSIGGPNVDHYGTKIWVYTPNFLTMALAMGPLTDLYPYVRDQFANNIQLSATVEHILPVPAPALFMDGPGWFTYAGKKVIGVIFNFDVKENVSGDFPVGA